jgi:hypothetical protein
MTTCCYSNTRIAISDECSRYCICIFQPLRPAWQLHAKQECNSTAFAFSRLCVLRGSFRQIGRVSLVLGNSFNIRDRMPVKQISRKTKPSRNVAAKACSNPIAVPKLQAPSRPRQKNSQIRLPKPFLAPTPSQTHLETLLRKPYFHT